MVQGLNISKNALIVHQAALSVIGNNIANMNTIGYSKQRVNLEALHSNSIVTNAVQQASLGYGVDIESISRYRDAFIDSYYRDAMSAKNYFNTIAENGSLLENLSNELSGTGLSSYLNSFFSAANNLSLYPTNITMKTSFSQEAANVVTELNNVATQLINARTNLVGDVSNPVTINSSTVKVYCDEVNQIMKDIAAMNKNIIYQNNVNIGASSGLLDERDILIDKLSEYIPVDVEENPNGSVNISLGPYQLIGGSDVVGELKVKVGDENNPAIISIEGEDGYVYSENVKPYMGQAGKISAILTLGGDSTSELTVKSMLDNLNLIAQQIAQQFNDLQQKTEDGPPAMAAAYYNAITGELEKSDSAIFVPKDTTSPITALNICVNKEILDNPQKIATAYVELDDDGNIKNPDDIGNNKIAQGFVDLREQQIPELLGMTFEKFNTSVTTDFGSKLSSAKTNLETQEDVFTSANEKREATIGVNIEEELMDLVKFQRAYEASAKVFGVADEILQTLVNLAR